MMLPDECLAPEHGHRVPCPGCGWDGTFHFQIEIPEGGAR